MRNLEKLVIKNFKSIREQTLHLGSLNVFIGANGSGKSNLVEIFPFVRRLVEGQLQLRTGVAGGADRLLFFGRKRSQGLSVEIEFAEGEIRNGYRFLLVPTAEDRFVFGQEVYWFQDRKTYKERPFIQDLGAGHAESKLRAAADRISAYVLADLASYRLYHFHDTSSEAKVKQTCDVADNQLLRADASNLAAYLYVLQERNPEHFRNIEDTIRQVAPFLAGFQLRPTRENPDKIRLEWRHRGSDDYLNGSALSDGTLRFICLVTLLLQPELPRLILLDEPELGLHPAAIVVLAGLLRSAATRTQILLATQSVTLLNQFNPEQVMVVDREEEATVFRPLTQMDQSAWLDGYALGELWEMNFLGGRP